MNQEFINELAGKLQTIGSLHAIGDTWISFDSTIPAGGVPFFGQLVDRTLWKDLFNWATNKGKIKSESEWQSYSNSHGGNCPYYSEGDGSTTFRVPKVSSYLKGVTKTDDGGSYISEGLPNIEGTIVGCSATQSTGGNTQSGAFYNTTILNTESAGGSSSDVNLIGFDASRSNPIYGNSDHVTPETYGVIVGVYAVGVVSNIGNLDAGELSSTVAKVEAKIDSKLENSTVHLVETWKASDKKIWCRKYSDGWIEQGGYFTPTSAVLTTVTFPMAFTELPIVLAQDLQISASVTSQKGVVNALTPTSVELGLGQTESNALITGGSVMWYAYGY